MGGTWWARGRGMYRMIAHGCDVLVWLFVACAVRLGLRRIGVGVAHDAVAQ